MTPAARLQAAIDILDEMNRSLVASDKFLRGWWGARRFAGSKDRAAVSERVYAVLRRRASLSWRMQSDSPRALVIASLLAEGASPTAIEGLFDGSQYGPQSLSSEEKAAIVGTPAPPPDYVCGDFPEWLDSELRRSLGDSLLPEMAAMRERAAVDLRVNTLKAQRDDMLVGLQALDMETRVTSFSPWGLRLDSDQRLSMLSHTQFFQTGAFEFQDEASQLVALLCAAKRGERVLDIEIGRAHV